ncbi:MAG: glycosyltransferase family 4 protein [Candidatus Bathyarchaeia archaeon]
MKKRIGVIMYQTSRTKGQELVAQRMVRYFRNLGNESYLITSVYHDGKETVSEQQMGEKGYFLVNDVELDIPVIRVASLVSKWPPRRIGFKDVVHTLERIVNDFQLNVLITHSTLWNGPEEVAKFVEWRRNIKALGGYQAPLVFCHMSHFQEPSPRRYSIVERSFRMAWNRLSLRTILRVANLILVVTPYEEEAKVKMGAPKNRLLLFPGGIDDVSFSQFSSSNPQELLKQLGIPTDSKIVAFVGTIENRKNPTAICDVAERLTNRNDIQFVIGGAGDSEYADLVRKKAEGLPNVKYIGELSEKAKVQLIQSSYLNIILSRMEALGVTQLEFMFEGIPVITSGVGGQSWIVRNGEEGIQVKGPEDIDGAVNTVIDLADDKSKWQKLSTNARERASKYTLTNLMHQLDSAITREIENESGLSTLPSEVRSTISEPEYVVHTWSHGTLKVAATERRMFIQRGRLSRSTVELPYSSIHSIEHVRQYRWKALLTGGIFSALLFIQHYVSPIISRTLTSSVMVLASSLVPNAGTRIETVIGFLWVVPISLAAAMFLIGTRKGYALHGATLDPIYLPPSFSEAVQHVRDQQSRPWDNRGNVPNFPEESTE